jgi:hypothetical protein
LKTYQIITNGRLPEVPEDNRWLASDLPAALHGFYAANGPASGGRLVPSDIISISETDDTRKLPLEVLKEAETKMCAMENREQTVLCIYETHHEGPHSWQLEAKGEDNEPF